MESLTREECEAYQVLLGFSAHMLRGSLTEEGLGQMAALAPQLLEEPFASIEADAAREASAQLAGAADGSDAAQALYHELRQDYAYLFYSIPLSGCSPYESVYRTPDRTMFGPTTFEVREIYRQWDLELATDEHEPDDHIATELEFAATLLAHAAEGNEIAEPALADFLSKHMLVFAPDLLARIAEKAETPTYRAVGAIASAAIASLADRLGAAPEAD